MPYSTVTEARKSVPSLKNMKTKQVRRFIDVFNALVEDQNMSEEKAIPIAISQAKKEKDKKPVVKATTSDVEMDDSGNLVYSGKKFPGYNKPVKSDRDGKVGMVLAKKGDQIKLIHFGASDYDQNYSVEANDAYYSRHGEEDDKFSARYWSHVYLWPRGNLKGKGPKPLHELNKSINKESKTLFKNSEEMVSYEIVMEPLEKDAHGEWATADTIRSAYENFTKNYNLGNITPNLYHLYDTDKYDIQKTWINEELDVEVIGTGEVIKAGSWVCKIKYLDNDLWEQKKQRIIMGISIQASGNVDDDTGEITNITFDPLEDD